MGFPSTQSCGDLSPLCQSSPIIHGTLTSITSQPVRRVPSAPSSSQSSLGDSGHASTGLRLQEEDNRTGSALSPPSLPACGTVTASPSLHQCPHRCRLMPCGRALPAPPAPCSLQKKTVSGSGPLPELGFWQCRHVGHGVCLHAPLADELQRASSVYFSLLETQTRGTGRIMTSCVLLLMLN